MSLSCSVFDSASVSLPRQPRAARVRDIIVQRVRKRLISKAHRPLYHSALGFRVIKKKRRARFAGEVTDQESGRRGVDTVDALSLTHTHSTPLSLTHTHCLSLTGQEGRLRGLDAVDALSLSLSLSLTKIDRQTDRHSYSLSLSLTGQAGRR